jgi:hypothetical protein
MMDADEVVLREGDAVERHRSPYDELPMSNVARWIWFPSA